MILISIFLFVSISIADEQEKNFKKAGLAELHSSRLLLENLKKETDAYFQSMPQDSVVTGEEMKELRMLKEKFTETKTDSDKHLAFYNIETKTKLSSQLLRTLSIYFESGDLRNHKDNEEYEVKKIFVEMCGHDLRILTKPNWSKRIFGAIIFSLVLLVVFMVIVFGYFEYYGKQSFFVLLGIVLVFSILFLFI